MKDVPLLFLIYVNTKQLSTIILLIMRMQIINN